MPTSRIIAWIDGLGYLRCVDCADKDQRHCIHAIWNDCAYSKERCCVCGKVVGEEE
jgi:hypothetical protein